MSPMSSSELCDAMRDKYGMPESSKALLDNGMALYAWIPEEASFL